MAPASTTHDADAPAGERAPTRRRRDDDGEGEGARLYHSANADGNAAAGFLLHPLTGEQLRRSESMVAKPTGVLAETRRLCTLDCGDLGRAAEVHILSDGKFSGAMSDRCNAAPSVVAGREQLVAWVEDVVEAFLGDDLTGEAGTAVHTLGLGITTAQLTTVKVVKLLDAVKEMYTEAGTRTVVSEARFGSMTGVPPTRVAHGCPRRQCTHLAPSHCTRAPPAAMAPRRVGSEGWLHRGRSEAKRSEAR